MKDILIGLAVVLAVVAVSCDKVPLTSPTGSSITLSIDKSIVPVGGQAQVTAVVIESAGTPVQNGTLVTFSTTMGSVSPAEAETVNGRAVATYIAPSVSGSAKINAYSGAASTGSGNVSSGGVTVLVGAAAVGSVSLNVVPSGVPQNGGSVSVVASVLDSAGNPLPSVGVTFTTDQGTLGASTVLTDSAGNATTTLTTSRAAKITAAVGDKKGEFTIGVILAPTVTVGNCTASPTASLPVTCTITPTVLTGGSPISNVTVNWGDGTPEVNLGTVTGATPASHVYTRGDTYTVTARATDTAGQTGVGTASVVVVRTIPTILIEVTTPSTGSASVGASVVFRVTPPSGSGGVATTGVTVDFGDGTTRNLGAITAPTSVTKVYSSEGAFTASATVTDAAGTRNTSSTAILITRAANPTITFTQDSSTTPPAVVGTNESFTVSAQAGSGLTIRSVAVVLVRTGETLYSQSGGGGTFATDKVQAGDVLRATATDSAGNTATFDRVVQ